MKPQNPTRVWDADGPCHPCGFPDPHGVDGPDELAVAIGKGAGGVCVASGIFGAVDVGIAAVERSEESVPAPVTCNAGGRGEDASKEAPEHSGTFRRDIR